MTLMMTSIFTSFDMTIAPSSSLTISLTYSLIPAFLFIQTFWINPPTRWWVLTFLTLTSLSLIKPTQSRHLKATLMLLFPSLYTLVALNLNSALPYLPSPSAHLMLTMSLGFPLWFSLVLASLSNQLKKATAHYLPEAAPQFIASFLAAVEALSSYIRPITLSFRLAANISAGHVILGMMTTALTAILLSSLMLPLAPSLLLTTSTYAMFELMICLVQAFVFILLTSMYTIDYLPRSTATKS